MNSRNFFKFQRNLKLGIFFELFLKTIYIESLILAQDERWRRALSMQVKGPAREPADG
jgi:hypothetical protein